MASTVTHPTKWDVRISFADDEHRASAWTVSKDRAFNLVLVDARMGSPFGIHAGKVLSWDAVPAEEVAA